MIWSQLLTGMCAVRLFPLSAPQALSSYSLPPSRGLQSTLDSHPAIALSVPAYDLAHDRSTPAVPQLPSRFSGVFATHSIRHPAESPHDDRHSREEGVPAPDIREHPQDAGEVLECVLVSSLGAVVGLV